MKKLLVPVLLVLFSCEPNPKMNRLADSSSPYLQQHATNPVDWYPWGEEALKKAIEEDKPIIVSIGYSSCHWCHVMAHESFEDSATAAIMNENFINIKVDREERPDVDQVYMDAVQKMGLNGGWPLNVFLTPDQRPFYGGTYFPREQWKSILQGVARAFKQDREQINESARQFAAAIGQSEFGQYELKDGFTFTRESMDSAYMRLNQRFDPVYGGLQKAPKFPMPAVWNMLATYSAISNNEEAKKHFLFTMDKIAAGGIYDQVGGGFARYSVDGEWHVPHFEKMLYDNGQLLSLYADAYRMTGNPEYARTISETVDWLEREMLDKSGGFYSALDADSEGEEGKFYVWTSDEVESMAGNDFPIIKDYYDVQPNGNWEDGKNVLRRLKSDEEVAQTHKISIADLQTIVTKFNQKALKIREKRERPGLDNKIIAGWNGLALSGLCDAYLSTSEERYLELAKTNANFLSSLVRKGQLKRFPNSDLEGFLEDYAAVIRGFIDYYQTTFDPNYLDLATDLTERVRTSFYDESEGYFFFSSDGSEQLIARKKELFDNVIPSSNSIMAENLFELGTLRYNDEYIAQAREMTGKLTELMTAEPEYLSNWAGLAMKMESNFAEIVIIGPDYQAFTKEIQSKYLPNKVISAAPEPNNRPMFEMKTMMDGKTTVFVCYNRACKLPVTSVEKALAQLK